MQLQGFRSLSHHNIISYDDNWHSVNAEVAIEMHLSIVASVRDMLKAFPNWEKT